jgi:phosphomannomutase
LKTWIFDVDATLTPPRSKMDYDFEEFFYNWILDNDTYLCSGSDIDKLKEQLTPRILNNVKGVFTCMANAYYERGKEIYRKDFEPPIGLEEDLKYFLFSSLYEKRTGNHIEKRVGIWNYSIVGRNANSEEREHFKNWDEKYGSRKTISSYLNSRYRDTIESSIGGDISIDIYNLGCDKRQVVKYLSGLDFSNVVFVGDRICPGGNDYELAKAVEAHGGKSVNVLDWEETRKILLNT